MDQFNKIQGNCGREISLISISHNYQLINNPGDVPIKILITKLRVHALAISRTDPGNKEIASFRSYQLSTVYLCSMATRILSMHGLCVIYSSSWSTIFIGHYRFHETVVSKSNQKQESAVDLDIV